MTEKDGREGVRLNGADGGEWGIGLTKDGLMSERDEADEQEGQLVMLSRWIIIAHMSLTSKYCCRRKGKRHQRRVTEARELIAQPCLRPFSL